LHVSNISNFTGGMEISAHELAAAIHLSNSKKSEFRLILGAHPNSDLMEYKSDTLFVQPAIDDTINFSKQKEINDTLLSEIINRAINYYGNINLILDQTSSIVPTTLSKGHGIKCIKTLRLNSNLFDFDNGSMPDCVVHLSKFSTTLKKFECKNIIIYDYTHTKNIEDVSIKKQPYALSIGRVHWGKGHLEALRICKRWNLQLKVVGPIVDSNYAKDLEIGGAILYGGIKRSQVLNLIKESSCLFWLPQELEPSGRVVIESLKLGTPVFANKIGIAADIISLSNIPPINFEKFYKIDHLTEQLKFSFADYGNNYLKLITDILSI
jgi:glycosyltransferase involved in cell wall biosynthesis